MLQGKLGVLVERYEIFAKDFERQEAPTTCHVVDVRVLQRVFKTLYHEQAFVQSIPNCTATAANTPGLHNNRISAQTIRNRFTCTTSLRRMRFNATSSSSKSS